MKTPREILFKQHRQAQPKLDAIRHAVLSAETQAPSEAVSFSEILRSFRWHLAGLSAVWLFILILHTDTGQAPLLAAATPKSPPPQVMIASMREHRRLLSEMVDAHRADGERRELFLPKPRSESGREFLIT